MVKFTDICFDNTYVWAVAEDFDFNVKGNVKLNMQTEEFETDCKEYNQFKKALWNVVSEIEHRKVKQHDERVIAWG